MCGAVACEDHRESSVARCHDPGLTVRNLKIVAAGFLACIGTLPAAVGAEADASYRIVLATDRIMTGAMLLSSDSPDARYQYVNVRTAQFEEGKKGRVLSEELYAVDCAPPLRLKLLATQINKAVSEAAPDDWITIKADDVPESFVQAELPYQATDKWTAERTRELRKNGVTSTTPSGVLASAEYACRAQALALDSRDAVAEKLQLTAGYRDVKELECQTSLSSKSYTFNYAFTETGRYVRWNRRWMMGAYVRERELGWEGSNTSVAINRRSGAATVTIGGVNTTGLCITIADGPKKF